MPKIFTEWTVLPHGALTQLDEDLWTVTGELHMPLTPLERRMTVVRLLSRQLVIYSAIALDEPQMKELESWGTPSFLIVPGDRHRMDAGIWKKRYPDVQIIAPSGARDAVEKVVPVDATDIKFTDERLQFVTVRGMTGHEAALLVRRSAGTTLVVNDIIGNMPADSGMVLRLTRFAGDEPHVPLPVKYGVKEQIEPAGSVARVVRYRRPPAHRDVAWHADRRQRPGGTARLGGYSPLTPPQPLACSIPRTHEERTPSKGSMAPGSSAEVDNPRAGIEVLEQSFDRRPRCCRSCTGPRCPYTGPDRDQYHHGSRPHGTGRMSKG